MIISGGSRSNWRFFGKHLMRVDENERVAIQEIRGLAADTVLEALREMNALASGTRCKNAFYHANLNPRADEVLTPAQWEQAVDTLEKELGLDGHSRFVVAHHKEGREHIHVIWSRIDVDRMTAVSDSMNYAAHERAARTLEKAFGHAPVIGAHGSDGKRPDRRAKNWETFRGHGSGLDPQEIKREITALWQQADSGKAFVASLAEHGYQLCKGDRRDFCIMDAAGDVHSLARRIDGAKAAEIRARLADIDRNALPSVAEAKPVAPLSPASSASDSATVVAESRDAHSTPPASETAQQSTFEAFARKRMRDHEHQDPKTLERPWDRPLPLMPLLLRVGESIIEQFARRFARTGEAARPARVSLFNWADARVAVFESARHFMASWAKEGLSNVVDHFRSRRLPNIGQGQDARDPGRER